MRFLQKHKETILYLFFGVLSTVINIFTYFIASRVLSFGLIQSNILAWVIAVIFAFITNKFFVFESKEVTSKIIIKEFISFIGCRVFSCLIEIILMYFMVRMLMVNDIIVKIITNVIVIIINYVLSKIIIFKKK
ncbi:MAG: GtrA family protein [Romboutsia sp.]|nr:GtrA family protein [Romboutsia sp.]